MSDGYYNYYINHFVGLGIIISKIPVDTTPKPIDEETRERRRLLAEKIKREADEREKSQNKVKEEDIKNYGICTNSIKWWFDSKTYLIRVYEESKTIIIKDEVYYFSDIIGVDYVDKIRNLKPTATTITNNKNMVGRALVGGLVAGGLGAAVGAVTAKQQTTYDNNDVHNYVVLVNTKMLSKPLIELRIGNNISQVNEILAILNAVIAHNQCNN